MFNERRRKKKRWRIFSLVESFKEKLTNEISRKFSRAEKKAEEKKISVCVYGVFFFFPEF